MIKLRLTYWVALLSIAVSGASILSGKCAIAQISSDENLPNNSKVIQENNTFNILEGTQRGGNLFHSFKEFSVPIGHTALFNNSTDIQNIISRVTGGSVSNINGLIKANGTANLFLINPNGIIFGQNARLEIGGSFLASTASSLKFPDNLEFSATNPQSAPLLSVNLPIGLQYGANPGSIVHQSQATSNNKIGLQVKPGNTLALIGGDVTLLGSILTAGDTPTATAGRIELGSVAGDSLVKLDSTDKGWILNYQGVHNFKDIQISQESIVNASGAGGGAIQVQGKKVSLTDRSRIVSFTFGSQPGGTVTLKASESLNLSGSQNQSLKEYILDITRFAGIKAKDDKGNPVANITNPSLLPYGIFTASFDSGGAGDIIIKTPKFSANNGIFVLSPTFDRGQGGTITLNSGIVELSTSVLGTLSGAGATGKAGNVILKSKRLTLSDYAVVTALSLGAGQTGNLNIDASQSVQLNGSEGLKSGTLPFQTPDVLFNTGLFSISSNADASGNLEVTTARLTLYNGASISAGTRGKAPGGDVRVTAFESLELSGRSPNNSYSTLNANASEGSDGQGGTVKIKTGNLIVQDGAKISVLSAGTGNAGNLEIEANSIRLDKEGSLEATASSGEGGNITLQVQNMLMLRRGSKISTNAGEQKKAGNGGNITIKAPFIIAIPSEDSDITANAYTGKGGRVDIEAFGIFGIRPRDQKTPLSDITASSELGVDGTIELNTLDIDPNSGLVELPTIGVDTEIAQVCDTPDYAQSSFIITGRGGLPSNPTKDVAAPDGVEVSWVSLKPKGDVFDGLRLRNSSSVISKPISNMPERIVEASGWSVNKKGEVVLTANASTAKARGSWQNAIACNIPHAHK
ncbi:MAG: filamentous hemagglutinin N-terminal domain-containing protein [Mojavia pulchra JT2-VF2]|uniref:Filamentous hemagglutinin N-terminal domain-containing protein n=1 Tax=Mojavia pulchra JT2-VF2 TaxID=287848 RepID=A0A951UJ58_9NOST|nr:filamentous hemagglutinin N-terminal domain-containing protein [Mojavia pulchra JT2-VF2]